MRGGGRGKAIALGEELKGPRAVGAKRDAVHWVFVLVEAVYALPDLWQSGEAAADKGRARRQTPARFSFRRSSRGDAARGAAAAARVRLPLCARLDVPELHGGVEAGGGEEGLVPLARRAPAGGGGGGGGEGGGGPQEEELRESRRRRRAVSGAAGRREERRGAAPHHFIV